MANSVLLRPLNRIKVYADILICSLKSNGYLSFYKNRYMFANVQINDIL